MGINVFWFFKKSETGHKSKRFRLNISNTYNSSKDVHYGNQRLLVLSKKFVLLSHKMVFVCWVLVVY